MKNKVTLGRRLGSLSMVLVGNILYALTVKLFVLPSELISCGTTGLAFTVHHLTGMHMSLFILLFNLAMLLVGLAALGREFFFTTVLSSLLYPVLLEVLERTLGQVHITDNMMLITLFAGIGLGLSLGIVLRAGASTGGMDIPTLILKKYFRIPVAASLWLLDFAIMLSQMLFHSPEDLLYGVLLLIVISFTLNKVMLLGTSRTEVKIVSERSDEIRRAILSQMDRGVTLLHGKGGYMGESTEVVLSVISNRELPKLERMARDIDPDCFMIVSRVTEVWGRGFSLDKKIPLEPPKVQ